MGCEEGRQQAGQWENWAWGVTGHRHLGQSLTLPHPRAARHYAGLLGSAPAKRIPIAMAGALLRVKGYKFLTLSCAPSTS